MSQFQSQMGAKIEKISTENEVGKNIEILSQKSIRPLTPQGSISRPLPVENLPKNTTKEKKQQRGVCTRWGTSNNQFQHAWEPVARSGSQLPTAIFPHRALEKRKREVKTSFGLCFEWIQKDYNRNCYKMHVKIIIFGPKTFKISSNWHPKSMSKP